MSEMKPLSEINGLIIPTPLIEPVSVAADKITIFEMRTRYVGFNDVNEADRIAWLDRVFHFVETFGYTPGETSYLSSAVTDFDVLMIGGNDVKRMAPLYRKNQAVLKNKLVIAVMRGSTPQRRAHLLYNGFDDVMDLTRVAPEEAIARMRAMRARQIGNMVREAAARKEDSRLGAICNPAMLTQRERKILWLLMERPGKAVSMEKLQSETSTSHEPVSTKNVQVSICLLRKKLNDRHKISYHSNGGYVLE